MTYEISVTMGRNVAGEPMPEGHWLMLGTQTEDTLAKALGHGPTEYWRGKGDWDDKREENLRLVWRVSVAPSVPSLMVTLAALAHEYGQDSIALAVGESYLVEADKTDIREITP